MNVLRGYPGRYQQNHTEVLYASGASDHLRISAIIKVMLKKKVRCSWGCAQLGS